MLRRKITIILTFLFTFFLFNEVSAHASLNTNRINGTSRYDTAIEISKRTFPNGTDTVIIVTGQDFPDALCATPLAYQLNAPILLTKSNSLPDSVRQEITRLGANRAIILGGNLAINDSVEQQLKNMTLTIERIAGTSRYDTSALIASKINSSTAIYANGRTFPDALASAPYAARNRFPILLTNANNLPDTIKHQTRAASIVLGGELAIDKNVEAQLKNVTRISGQSRYETNVKIVEFFDDQVNKAFITTGTNFADALTGSILAAKENEPVMLTKPEKATGSTLLFLKIRNTTSFDLLGGNLAVTDQVENALKGLDQKIFFTPNQPTYFLDEGSNKSMEGALNPNSIYYSDGLVDGQYYRFKYGNSNGLIDINSVKTNFSVDEIHKMHDELSTANSNKTILINKHNVTLYDQSLNNQIGVLYDSQRLPIISETKTHYIVNVAGVEGYISKQDVSIDNGIPVLMYHHILRNEENRYYRNVSTTISNIEFNSQMNLLNNYAYKTITVSELEDYLDKKRNLPANAIVITFDDGLKSVYKYALPELRKYNFKATEFIITGRIPNQPYPFNPDDLQFLSWQELNEMSDVFNYHSHTHALHQLTLDQKGYLITKDYNTVINDLALSSRTLNNSPYFAYPFGHYNSTTIQQLKQTGYRIAFTTKSGKVKLGDDKFQLKRVGIPPGLSASEFYNKIRN
ncbi:cell wall-binding repeat-containing protein [Robertmurraya kyonggiensis]|uniref:NodB homology domain-containing protein n=1 Tax=Robertmurraya kyonggiensis TaxID=1037680 RepID=A0A4U1D742_9BACI|nr:cell wall-binding repeat-containing protein [Robertmurraya kyonggiensis]TKC17007.1 hypothetical protein FA727_13190 [Robertmurraya kyonggiensis]